MSAGRKCSFKIEWLLDPNFKQWIEECKSNNSIAYCKFCRKNIDLTNMGVSALKSHMKSAKHVKYLAILNSSKPIMNHFASQKSSVGEENTNPSCATISNAIASETTPECTAQTLIAFNSVKNRALTAESALKSEILWILNVVMKHMSFNSCSDYNKLFPAMFPDSEIAKSFSCASTKTAYILCFGIAPYIKETLINSIRQAEYFTVCFDGSVNKFLQKDQVDTVIRFWDHTSQQVCSRYIGSSFLGHAKATDLMKALENGIEEFNSMSLCQIGMDGPNVNLKVHQDFLAKRKNSYPDYPLLIDIGSCSVHTVHRAFQIGAEGTGWDLANILRSLWQIFKDSPARKSDFMEINKTQLMPRKFCATRWVEDVAVAERAITIWPQVILFVESYKDKPRSAISSKSFQTIKEASRDPLLLAKLSFFSFVGKQVEPYLTAYQTDSPMIPFQASDIMKLLYTLMSLFVRKDVLDNINDHVELCSIDLDEVKNLACTKNVEVGFAVRDILNNSLKQKKVSEKEVLFFKSECLKFMKVLVKKIIDRNPLKYPVVRYARCFDPNQMFSGEIETVDIFSKLLQQLQNKKIITSSVCDEALKQFKLFMKEMSINSFSFDQFQRGEQRLDTFFANHLCNKKEYSDLWKIVKLILTLSHGQASVERGFSVNKEMIVENLKEETLVAMRIVYDQFKDRNIFDCDLSKDLLVSVRASRMRYQNYLDDQKKLNIENEKTKQKTLVQEEIRELKKTKLQLEQSIKVLNKEADSMAFKAEKKNDFNLLIKSNAFRKKSTEAAEQLETLTKKITELSRKI